MKPMLGSRNRLVRRLHQHANMTGLFHSGEALKAGIARAEVPGMASSANRPGLPFARAFLPAPEPAGEADLALSATLYAAPKLPLEGSSPGSNRIDAPVPVAPGSVFREPEAERIEMPAAEENGQPAGSDPVWHRLQSIFNKHRDKNAPQETASMPRSQDGPASPLDPFAPVTGGIEQASVTARPESPVADNEPGMSSLPTIQMKREVANATPVQPVDTAAPEVKQDANYTRAGQELASLQTTSVTTDPHPEVVQAALKNSPAVRLPTPSTRADEDAPAKPHTSITEYETLEESGQDEQPVKSLSQPMTETPEAHVHNLQSLPLQAVWAVETVHQPQSTFSPVPEESGRQSYGAEDLDVDRLEERAEGDQISIQRAAISDDRDDIVRSALQDVHTAQATDSGIEFIPTRVPRPRTLPTGSNAASGENADPPAELPSAALQRQAHISPRNEFAEPKVVPTEIGPLPDDLWNLIGASTLQMMDKSSEESPVSGDISKREEQSPLRSVGLPATHSWQPGQAPVVQRQIIPPAGFEAPISSSAAGEEAIVEQDGEEKDIEELARQVYSELKHRLGLEWERLRRR